MSDVVSNKTFGRFVGTAKNNDFFSILEIDSPKFAHFIFHQLNYYNWLRNNYLFIETLQLWIMKTIWMFKLDQIRLDFLKFECKISLPTFTMRFLELKTKNNYLTRHSLLPLTLFISGASRDPPWCKCPTFFLNDVYVIVANTNVTRKTTRVEQIKQYKLITILIVNEMEVFLQNRWDFITRISKNLQPIAFNMRSSVEYSPTLWK